MSSPLRILQIVQTLDPSVGGVAPAVLALSHGLGRRGHKVEVLALDQPGAPWLKEVDLPVFALGHGLTSYRYSSKLMPWLRKNGDNYDVVVVNGLWQYLSFAAWRRYGGRSIPYFVFPHGMLDPWFKRSFPLKHLKKWFYWPWGEYRVLRDAAAVIFTSEEERLQARQSFWLYRCREKVSPLGIEPPPTISPPTTDKFLDRFPLLRNKRLFLFLGRLHPKKGCDLLIDAFRNLQPADYALVLAGPDQIGWEKELARRAAGLPVFFTGMLQGEMKQAVFACADAFILPSHQENFGMSVAEALAAGLPALISNRVNIWREIEQDGAGYVENDDLAGTMRLIERWIGTSDDEKRVMRSNAAKCFANRFSIDRAVDSLLAVLTEAVAVR